MSSLRRELQSLSRETTPTRTRSRAVTPVPGDDEREEKLSTPKRKQRRSHKDLDFKILTPSKTLRSLLSEWNEDAVTDPDESSAARSTEDQQLSVVTELQYSLFEAILTAACAHSLIQIPEICGSRLPWMLCFFVTGLASALGMMLHLLRAKQDPCCKATTAVQLLHDLAVDMAHATVIPFVCMAVIMPYIPSSSIWCPSTVVLVGLSGVAGLAWIAGKGETFTTTANRIGAAGILGMAVYTFTSTPGKFDPVFTWVLAGLGLLVLSTIARAIVAGRPERKYLHEDDVMHLVMAGAYVAWGYAANCTSLGSPSVS